MDKAFGSVFEWQLVVIKEALVCLSGNTSYKQLVSAFLVFDDLLAELLFCSWRQVVEVSKSKIGATEDKFCLLRHSCSNISYLGFYVLCEKHLSLITC
jgi:hypothetical protein